VTLEVTAEGVDGVLVFRELRRALGAADS